MDDNKVVKCFDENDSLIGEMILHEAKQTALGAKKDLVLRNNKVNPPVVKIMHYKKELLKKLLKKLGKEIDEKDLKSKSIRISTTISYHDLENKKKQSKQLLKTHQILKFYMKVNIYDPENVQKGRMMLLNIAEDLKEDAKVTVSPKKDDSSDAKKPGEKKPKTPDDMMDAALESKKKQEEFVSLGDGEFEDEDYENMPEYVYMELRSTASFKDIDVDAMLEHTTFEDLMKGLYNSRIAGKQAASSEKGG